MCVSKSKGTVHEYYATGILDQHPAPGIRVSKGTIPANCQQGERVGWLRLVADMAAEDKLEVLRPIR